MSQFYKTLAVTTLLVAGFVYSVPQALPERFSRAVIRFGLYDLGVALFFTVFIYPFFFSPLRHLPGPFTYDILFGHGTAQFSKPPGNKMLQWVQNIPNDGILHFRGFFNESRLIPTTPETLKSVLADNAYDFEKPAGVTKFLLKILGAGLILVEGDVHKFQRKNVLPSFQLKHLKDLYRVFWSKGVELSEAIEAEINEKEHDKLKTGLEPVVEFGDWATRVTLDIIGMAGMGRDFRAIKESDDELVQAYNLLLEPTFEKALYFATNILGPQDLVQKLPWSQNRLLKDVTTNLKRFCLETVRRRKEDLKDGGKGGDDILTLLVKTNSFSDHELVDQMLTFLAAGHETTSSAMTWAMWLIATHPHWAEQLRQEVRENLPSPSSGQIATAAEVEALPILNAICNETLRLFPTVPVTIRQSIRATHVGSQPIPKGTRIFLVPWAINRSKHLWGDDSEKFMPERWLQEGTANTGGAKSNYAQITFLHGPRSCIGMGFAKAEFKCLLAVIAGEYDIKMADPEEKVYPAGVITTKPVHGMKLHMKKLPGW